jgi:DNA-binding CsgD family transcriptional regulator
VALVVCQTCAVRPLAKDYASARRAFERAQDRGVDSVDALIEAFIEATAGVLAVTSSCWHDTDPVTGAPLSAAALGDPPGSLEEALDYEFRRPDVSTFRDLRARRTPVTSISAETRDRLSASVRFREMIAPRGVADELRISFRDQFGTWAALVLFTARGMTPEDVRFVAELVPTATASLRSAVAARSLDRPAAGDPPLDGAGPSVLILDGSDRIVSADATARRRLELLPETRAVQVPGVISFLSAQARWDVSGRPATARMLSRDGRWFVLDASLLDGESLGNVAVVMRPTSESVVLDIVLRTLGLSAREREVATLAVQGSSTKQIAASLVLSPWTVQDHLKSAYEKAGVSGRADLAALASGNR